MTLQGCGKMQDAFHILFLYRRPRKEMWIYSLAGICFYKLRKPNEF